MSVTVSLVPVLLMSSVGVFTSAVGIAASAIGITELSSGAIDLAKSLKMQKIHLGNGILNEFFNKDFQTEINDKELLIKTLEEHGAQNIYQDGNSVSCDCENFHFDFFKDNENPYIVSISYANENGLEEMLGDINSEYRANVRDISYNKIKERLAAQNLTIDEEEIQDDDTIVLTVNLE